MCVLLRCRFEGDSTTKTTFRPHDIQPAAPCRPPPMMPSAPFEGGSTMKEAFKGWRLPAHRGALGLEMFKDRFYILIPSDATLPAVGQQVGQGVHRLQKLVIAPINSAQVSFGSLFLIPTPTTPPSFISPYSSRGGRGTYSRQCPCMAAKHGSKHHASAMKAFARSCPNTVANACMEL